MTTELLHGVNVVFKLSKQLEIKQKGQLACGLVYQLVSHLSNLALLKVPDLLHTKAYSVTTETSVQTELFLGYRTVSLAL